MTNNIHKTAIIEDGAQIGNNVTIGAYSVIGPNVKIGDNCTLKSHVVIEGDTIIDEGCTFFPFASIGQIPQDKKYRGEKTQTIIGKNNNFREYTTVNAGTEGGILKTIIGDNCLFMANSHIAHDCIIGNNVIIANSVAVAGHVEIGDFAIIGGLSAIHQFVRIGKHAMVGGMSGVEKDVIPYGTVLGERASLSGLNIVGLKRRGFSKTDINDLRNAYEKVFYYDANYTFQQKLERAVEEYKDNAFVMELLGFMVTDSSRAICQPKVA